MSLQTSIVKGLLASTGLLAGSGAMAGMTATYQYSESGYVFHYVGYLPVADVGRFSGADNVGSFSKAHFADVISVFNYGISEKLLSAQAKSTPNTQGNWWLGAWDKSNLRDWYNRNGATKSNGPYVGAPQPATSVPEPASLALLGLGLAGIGLTKRANRKDRK